MKLEIYQLPTLSSSCGLLLPPAVGLWPREARFVNYFSSFSLILKLIGNVTWGNISSLVLSPLSQRGSLPSLAAPETSHHTVSYLINLCNNFTSHLSVHAVLYVFGPRRSQRSTSILSYMVFNFSLVFP